MLVELSMVEQRYEAVREVLETGTNVTDVATRYGIDRRTLHRWLVRYANEGLTALADRSSKPDRCPHQIDPDIEARIVELRRAHPGWGPRTILNKLRRELDEVPSRSAIYRCLVRHRLIQPKARRRRRDDYKRWERARSMELWQQSITAIANSSQSAQHRTALTAALEVMAGQIGGESPALFSLYLAGCSGSSLRSSFEFFCEKGRAPMLPRVGFYPIRRIDAKARKAMKARIRRLTSRTWGISMKVRIAVLNRYIRGWCAYFALADTPSVFDEFDQWLRRRLRQVHWKQWPRVFTRYRKLRALGIPVDKSWQWAASQKGAWRMAGSAPLQRALPHAYCVELGLRGFGESYRSVRTVWRTA